VTAKYLLKTRRYVYGIFMCHLTIEKLLKACVTEFTEKFPPKIHELDKLARLAGIEFPPELAPFVLELSAKSVPISGFCQQISLGTARHSWARQIGLSRFAGRYDFASRL
jgi:hypothetical protein